ncbi:hypothetical protein [Pseudomonas sp.]|uniref:hypothetical protein n=1 Tax=Pseudomonas sp. TaxID=306 RepID=UPI003C753B18
MKTGSIICLALFILGSLLSLAQLWFEPLTAEVFTKLIVTLVILFVVVLGVTLVRNEYIENKKMKDSGHID